MDYPSASSVRDCCAHASLDYRCDNRCRLVAGLAGRGRADCDGYSRRMKSVLFLFVLSLAKFALAENPWRVALPGWRYEFPRDHFAHPDFKTEWWYFTGNLRDSGGKRYGYQLTFFRQGIRPLAACCESHSRVITDKLKFAHFAVSDPNERRFLFVQKTSRGAFGEAGFAQANHIAWIDEWSLELLPDGTMEILARMRDASLAFAVKPEKPWIIHGENGVSQKADGE